MQAVGLHFGHDASCALVAGDGIRHFLDKERRSRVKHALSLSSQDVREVLSRTTEDVVLGLSCTQGVPILMDGGLEVEVDGGSPTEFDHFLKQAQDHHYAKFMSWISNPGDFRGLLVRESLFPYQSRFNEGFNSSYEAIGAIAGQFSAMSEAQHREAALRLDGKCYKARFYQHHYLHAAYAGWAMSPDKPALILTADGGAGPSYSGGGIYYWRPDSKLLPITPIDGWVGQFYDCVSEVLGFDGAGGAGKLMGLAPYGRPIYFDNVLVGTRRQVTSGYEFSIPKVVQRWLSSVGVDSAKIPKWDLFTDVPPVLIADIAASAQLVVERNMQELGRAAERLARRGSLEVEAFILCGGVALNCPANSNLAVTLGKPVLVPPAVNDEGLSIGAAIAAYYDFAGRYPAGPKDYADGVYIGTDISKVDVDVAAAKHGWRASEESLDRAAELILADVPIGLCVGKAEVGPRALGHRSILVNASSPNTWRAANHVKRREPWRPFAPAVLLEDAPRYFDRGPPESRYMLCNYRCNTKELPAITHYDHSSRVQHVSEQTGLLHQLLLRVKALGAPPVVLNTSFNGPGVPIVDTAEDAFAEASKLGLQYVLTDFGLYQAGQSKVAE